MATQPKIFLPLVVGCIIYYLKKMLMTLQLDNYSTTDQTTNPISCLLSKPERQHIEAKTPKGWFKKKHNGIFH